MTRRHLLIVIGLLIICSLSCFLTYSALAQNGLVSESVGTPSCEAFQDQQGHPCYRLNCAPDPDSYSNYRTCDGQNISASLSSKQLCEIPPESGTIEDPITCNTSPANSMYFSYLNNAGVEKAVTVGMTCPHSCVKCATEPNGYGLCPSGYKKNTTTNCCVYMQYIASQSSCNEVNGYWNSFSNTCQESPPQTQSECNAFSW